MDDGAREAVGQRALDGHRFAGDDKATVYYLPGMKGWDSTFGGRPTAVWKP